MNPSPLLQNIGNVCVVLAALMCLLPLPHLLSDYARKEVSHNQWVTPALFILIPLWLLLLGALLCVTASGGFDWLRLGRPALYPLTVAAALALAAVMFVFVALYIRPGFTPRSLYSPVIYLVPLATGLLVVLSLNPKLLPGIPTQWWRWPWTIFAALSLVAGVGFIGYWTLRMGAGGVVGIAHRIRHPGPSSGELLAQISTLDPEKNFEDLLRRASPNESSAVREAATARLRTNPGFGASLAAALANRDPSTALGFLASATLSTAEQAQLARPARTALEHLIDDIPAPNFMPSDRRKQLQRWGRKTIPAIAEKFSATDVDFKPTLASFEHALRPDDTRR